MRIYWGSKPCPFRGTPIRVSASDTYTLWERAYDAAYDGHTVGLFGPASPMIRLISHTLGLKGVHHCMLLHRPHGHCVPIIEGTTGEGLECMVADPNEEMDVIGFVALDMQDRPGVQYLDGARAGTTTIRGLWETFALHYRTHPLNRLVRAILKSLPPRHRDITCAGYILHRLFGYRHETCRNDTITALVNHIERYTNDRALSDYDF